jgi:heat shock protein HtpX
MRRGRARRRDAGLVVRMLFVLALLAATCVAIAAAFVWLFAVEPRLWPYWSLLALALVVAGAVQYRRAKRRLLAVAGARVVDAASEPELHALVERVAAMFDLRPPRIAVSRSPVPNSFALGVRKSRAVVVVSEGLRRRLEPDELEAVLAHELAHVANSDAAVMTLAGVPRAVGFELYDVATRLYLWLFLWPVGALLYGWGSLLTLAVSRYREYTADAGSALATGRPAALMSALQKLSTGVGLIPREDLRGTESLEPLFIVPVSPRRIELFADHPPLEKRLARLATIAREMGKTTA